MCFNVDSYKPIMYLQFPLDKCHFLVDLDLSETTPLQPRYSRDTARWETLVKRPFLDANRFDVCLCVWMYVTVINPQRACAARVTVVVLCVSVSRPRIRYSRNYKTK